MTIRFTVPGEPRAKAKKLGVRGRHATAYNDPATDAYQNRVVMAAREVLPPAPFDGPIVLRITAVYPRTAAQCRRSTRTGLLLGGVSEDRIPKATKPDNDNVWKAVADGITAAGVWTDDARVFDGRVVMWHAAIGEFPHLDIEIREYAD